MTDPQQTIDALAQRQTETKSKLESDLLARLPQIENALPKHMVATAFLRVATTSIQQNSKLRACTGASLVGGIYQAASLGLMVDGVLGHAYLVPYKVKGVQVAQLQVGYRGYCDLAYRSGRVTAISAEVVYEGDDFEYNVGTSSFLRHSKPLTGDRGDALGVFALAEMKSGHPVFRVVTQDEVHKHRSHSKAYKYAESGKKDSPWHEHPDAMWEKTAIRMLSKVLPQATELQGMALADEARDHGRAAPAATMEEATTVIDVVGDDVERDEFGAEVPSQDELDRRASE